MKCVINNLDHYGRGIAKINNKVCFIENALPGEIVEIKITKDKKKYLEAKVTNYLEVSDKRIKEKCPYFDICGGCNLLHIDNEDENTFKEKKVHELIEKFTTINDFSFKNISSNKEYNYRNKVVFHVKDKHLGFYKRKTNDLIEINNCLLLCNEINKLIPILKSLVKLAGNDITTITVKIGNITNETLIDIKGKVKKYDILLDIVDVLIINNKCITKKSSIISIIDNKKYLISANSFFQINKYETKYLYDEVLNIIKSKNAKNVLDLYCGTGTIGIYISDYVKSVIGIEVVKEAIDDANKNSKLNSCNNINFIAGKVEDIIPTINKKIDTIIMDPPRSGIDRKTIDNIYRINPENIIYISCDPVTLSRDINILKEKYEIEYIRPFNMFPKTYHVECISVLHRKNFEK